MPDNVIDELKGREHKGIIALPKAARWPRRRSNALESLRGRVEHSGTRKQIISAAPNFGSLHAGYGYPVALTIS